MITLSETGTLQAYLDDTPTNQPIFYADYIDAETNTPGQSFGGFNGYTTVDIVAPAVSGVRLIRQLHFVNKDIATREITVQVDDGIGVYAPYQLIRASVPSWHALVYNSAYGWFIQTINYNGTYQPLDADLTAIADAGAVNFGGFTSFEIPNGAGGTTDNAAGEICVDTTSKTVNFYDGAAEKVLHPQWSKSFYLEGPVAADDLPIHRFDQAVTLVKIVYAISGGTNWVGQLQEANDAQGTSAADTQAADSTVTGTTTVTSFSNASFDAGDYIRLKTTSVSGSVTWLHVTFYYTINP